ncbi:MAG: uncharacterized protein K0Q50_1720 [Vampirovibrio sp.]|nr:uncharacterized protein [Vampirovibrio sp.]
MGSFSSVGFNAALLQNALQELRLLNMGAVPQENNRQADSGLITGPSQDEFVPQNILLDYALSPTLSNQVPSGSGASVAPAPLIGNQKPTVALLEVYPDDPFNAGGRDGHDEAVAQTVQRFDPDATVKTYSFYKNTKSPSTDSTASPFTSVNELNQFIDQAGYNEFNKASQNVLNIVRNDPTTGVINMSLGISKKNIYQSVMDSAVNADPQTGLKMAQTLGINPADLQAYYNDPSFKDPQARAAIQSPAKTRIENAIAAYVDQRFEAPGTQGTKNFQAGLAEWQTATKQLADQGTVVVVSAGNDHNTPGFEGTVPSGSEFNLMAMSDHVISVAASTDNAPNGLPADFSSRGGGNFNPTLSADGTNIPVTLDGKRRTVNGTSFSAPTVAAAVADIKSGNPTLSFQQVKSILTSTADNTAASPQAEGAGILNFQRALSVANAQPAAQASRTVNSGNTGNNGISGNLGGLLQQWVELIKTGLDAGLLSGNASPTY